MHANPQRLQDQERSSTSQLRALPRRNTLGPFMLRFLRLLRLAFWRAFQHDAFAIAKAAAYSSILTFFPTLLLIGSVLATSRGTEAYLREISYALGKILPAGGATALAYLRGTTQRSVGVLITTSLITLWTGVRRHDFLDGRFSPLLRAAQELGTGERAADRVLAGHSCRHSADLLHHSGGLRQSH